MKAINTNAIKKHLSNYIISDVIDDKEINVSDLYNNEVTLNSLICNIKEKSGFKKFDFIDTREKENSQFKYLNLYEFEERIDMEIFFYLPEFVLENDEIIHVKSGYKIVKYHDLDELIEGYNDNDIERKNLFSEYAYVIEGVSCEYSFNLLEVLDEVRNLHQEETQNK